MGAYRRDSIEICLHRLIRSIESRNFAFSIRFPVKSTPSRRCISIFFFLSREIVPPTFPLGRQDPRFAIDSQELTVIRDRDRFFFFFQVECSKVVHGFRDIHGTNSNCARVVATCLHASRIRDYKPWSEPVSRRNRRNDTFNTGWNTELGAYWRGSKQFSRWVVWREKGEGEGRGEEKERSEPNWKLLSRDFPSGPRTIDAKVVVSTRESRAKWKKTPIGATNKVIARCSPE